MRSLRAAALYFLLVFAAGWGLGPVREFWTAPRYGALAAVLIEAPFMLAAMFFAARWAMRGSRASPAAVGLLALAMLLAAELAGEVWLRGHSPREALAGFASGPGAVGLLLFLVFAAMPALACDRPEWKHSGRESPAQTKH